MRVDEDGALEQSTDVTNLIVEKIRIPMENTAGDASKLNRKNERHNITIQKMVREGITEINQSENKCCCAAETSS